MDETGKFYLQGKGDKPVSFTAIPDVAGMSFHYLHFSTSNLSPFVAKGFIAHALTTLPPSQLRNAVFRIEGQRATLTEVAALFGRKVPIVRVDKVPDDIPGNAPEIRKLLQAAFEAGSGSSGWNNYTNEDSEPSDNARALWEGHSWRTIKETLAL